MCAITRDRMISPGSLNPAMFGIIVNRGMKESWLIVHQGLSITYMEVIAIIQFLWILGQFVPRLTRRDRHANRSNLCAILFLVLAKSTQRLTLLAFVAVVFIVSISVVYCCICGRQLIILES